MKTQNNDFSVLKEEISQNNVLTMAEFIALMETRFLVNYMGSRMQKMYADLFADIKHKHELKHTFSDSYDLVQEGALYLCDHYGKHLNDVIGYSKKGKPITIEIACIRKMMKLINRKMSDYYRRVSLEALTPVSEPSYEIKEEVLQEMEKLQKVLSMLNYKCWYYDQAIEKNDEAYVQALSFNQFPPQIQQYYKHSHEDC